MNTTSFRAIYFGNDRWTVRKFEGGSCYESQLILHVEDPESRSSDKAAIVLAVKNNQWSVLKP